MPGYDRSTRHHRDAWSFLELADGMREAIHVLRTGVGPEVKLIGFFHDWGCVVGSVYANRAAARGDRKELIPDRLILMDVLLPPRKVNYKSFSWNEKYQGMIVLLYQLPLAFSFWLDRYISRVMALMVLSMAVRIIPLLLLKHPKDLQHLEEKRAVKSPYLTYPYYHALKSLVTLQKREFAYCSLPTDLTKMPVLFLHGQCKKVALHVRQGEDLLNRENEKGNASKVAVIPNGGHWFYLHDLDECWGYIQAFLT